MNLLNIAMITMILAFTFYLIFLAVGVIGIPKNLHAQGIDQDLKK